MITTLLGTTVPNLTTNFVSSFNNLPCWNLPSLSSPDQVSFDLLIKGFIPSALTNLLSTVANKKEVASINNIISTAQLTFHDDIWNYRCKHFNKWERTQGITSIIKKGTS